MTASELLRRIQPINLTVKVGKDDPYPVAETVAYEVPLPLIADCIESAERVLQRQVDGEPQEWAPVALARTLGALSEHLEGGDE